jgi:hypothetical protein
VEALGGASSHREKTGSERGEGLMQGMVGGGCQPRHGARLGTPDGDTDPCGVTERHARCAGAGEKGGPVGRKGWHAGRPRKRKETGRA